MNSHKKKTAIEEALALVIALTVGATPTLAVHDQGGFELDRDAVDSNGGPKG